MRQKPHRGSEASACVSAAMGMPQDAQQGPLKGVKRPRQSSHSAVHRACSIFFVQRGQNVGKRMASKLPAPSRSSEKRCDEAEVKAEKATIPLWAYPAKAC